MSRKIKAAEIEELTTRIIGLIKQYGFDDETIEALNTFDPEFRAQLLEKLCAAIGEFIDLLAQPDTNEFGYKHNTSVRTHGINHTIFKIIDELELIGKSTSDDKSSKRLMRYKFLVAASTIELCRELFSIMCNYLNGGNTGEDQYSSPVVVTAGGGNLITIFAQFLDDIATSDTIKSIIKPFRTMLKNLGRIKDTSSDKLMQDIKDAITSKSAFRELIREIANGPRSDLDFKLAPNISASRNKSSTTSKPKHIYTELQFILARLKISKVCNIANLTREQQSALKKRRIELEKLLKSSCYSIAWTYKKDLQGKFDDIILKNLYTGQMKTEYLRLIQELRDKQSEKKLQEETDAEKAQSKRGKKNTNDHSDRINNCYKYLLQLSLRKEYNDKATRKNVDEISRMFAQRRTVPTHARDEKNQTGLPSPKMTSDSESESPKSNASFRYEQSQQSWSRIEAETLIEKIRTYTQETNKFIKHSERMRGITPKIIDDCFKTIFSLMKANNSLIINLIADILGNFITEEKFRTADILKAIQASYNGKSLLEQSKVVSPSYTPTPDSEKIPTYDSILTPIEAYFETIISDRRYNKGLKILLMVLNHIDYSSKSDSSKSDSSKSDSSKSDSSKSDSSKSDSSKPHGYTDDEIDAILSVLDEYSYYDEDDDKYQLTEQEIEAILDEISADKTITPTIYSEDDINAVLAEITREEFRAKQDALMRELSGGSKKNNMIKKKTVKKKKTRKIATLKHKKYKK
jgi:hypothetical protein